MKRRLQNRLLHLLTEKERKRGKRITQTELANAIGVNNHTVAAWLSEDFPPTKIDVRVLENLCDYFECDVGDLLFMNQAETEAS